MKTVFFVFLLGLLCMFVSCGSGVHQEKKTTSQQKPLSLIDSLNKKVNEGHDLSMSKMGAMVLLHRSINECVDSLKKQKPVNELKINELQKASHNLDIIKGSMYTWMDNFDFELKGMDSVAKVAYLQTNLKRIQAIDDSTIHLIDEANKALLP